jgi:hypothetical protein
VSCEKTFAQHVISRAGDVPWPACSPDLSTYDYFLWGYLKSKVLISKPTTIEELKQRIKEEIAAIPEQMTSSSDGKSSRKIRAVFEKWWETSE